MSVVGEGLAPEVESPSATVVFVDVGQGDATVIIDHATQEAIVVDCPSGAEDAVAAVLDDHSASLHTGVITHFDDDHSSGLIALVSELGAKEVVLRIVPRETPHVMTQYRRLASALSRYGFVLQGHQNDSNGRLGRCVWTVVGPSLALELSSAGRTTLDRNRASLVVRVDIEPEVDAGVRRRVLLPGDCDRAAWLSLLEAPENIRASFLRWPHHGAAIVGQSKRLKGKTLAFDVLDAVGPAIAYMGIGSGNTYGHPASGSAAALADRTGTAHYCSQVTSRCTSDTLSGPTKCAGNLSIHISPDGSYQADRDPAKQEAFVLSQWDRPACVN